MRENGGSDGEGWGLGSCGPWAGDAAVILEILFLPFIQ